MNSLSLHMEKERKLAENFLKLLMKDVRRKCQIN